MSEGIKPEMKGQPVQGHTAVLKGKRDRKQQHEEEVAEEQQRGTSLEPEDAIADPKSLWEDPPASGDSAGISARVSVSTKALIQQVVQSGLFPYRNESDLIRPALAWWLREKIAPYMDGRFDKALAYQEQLKINSELQRRLDDIERMCNSVKNAVRTALKHGLERRAKDLIREMLTRFPDMGDTEWQQQTLREIRHDTLVGALLEKVLAEELAKSEE